MVKPNKTGRRTRRIKKNVQNSVDRAALREITRSIRPAKQSIPSMKKLCSTAGARYIGTLVDPWAVKNVRIPDELTYPSATLPLVLKTTINPVSDGAGGWASGLAISPEVLFKSDGTVQGGIFTLHTATPAGQVYYSTAATDVLFFPQQLALPTVLSTFRVVSCGIAGWSSASMMNNQGWCTAFAISCGGLADAPFLLDPATGFNAHDIQSLAYSNKKPMQNNCVCAVNYWPDASSQYDYKPRKFDFLGETNRPHISLQGLYLGGLPNGMSAPVVPLELTIVLNIEYRVNPVFTSIVTTRSSTYCVNAMEAALNVAPPIRRFNAPARDIMNATPADEEPESEDWYSAGRRAAQSIKAAWDAARPFLPSYQFVASAANSVGGGGAPMALPYH
jgi:hypothetical protein